MAAQSVSGVSPVQPIAAYGSTQSDISSLEKQRNRLMMELDKVNAAQGSEMQTPYRREQLQRQIRLLEVQLMQKSGSGGVPGFVFAAPLQDQPRPWRSEGRSGFRASGLSDPRTATVDRYGRFDALI